MRALKIISLGGTLLSVFKLPGFLTKEQSLRVRAGSYSGVAPGSVSFIVGAQYGHEWIFLFFFFLNTVKSSIDCCSTLHPHDALTVTAGVEGSGFGLKRHCQLTIKM